MAGERQALPLHPPLLPTSRRPGPTQHPGSQRPAQNRPSQPKPEPPEAQAKEDRRHRRRRGEDRGAAVLGCGRHTQPRRPPICWLKATKPETVLSYSWCLGHFIKHLRHRADYFSGNSENRKAESTESVTSCFRSGSYSHVWVGARVGREVHSGGRLRLVLFFHSPLAFRCLESRRVKPLAQHLSVL